MIGILNNMMRHATRTDGFETGYPKVREDRDAARRDRRIHREALFRARGWGR